MINTEQQEGFDQLRFNGGRTNCNNGFVGENGRTFRNCPNIAGEAEIGQISKEFLTEHLTAAQIFNVFSREMEVLDVVDDQFQTCSDGKTAAIRATPEKQIKVSDAIPVAFFEVTLAHGQFIKVTEHGQVQFITGFHMIAPRNKYIYIYYRIISLKYQSPFWTCLRHIRML